MKKTYKDTDIISVKSLVDNVHYTCPKTLDYFHWTETGDKLDMTIEQFKTMLIKYKNYIKNRWLMPCDSGVINYLNIQDYYFDKWTMADTKLLKGNDVEAVKKRLLTISKEDLKMLKQKVIAMCKSEEIANIPIIRFLEKYLNIELINNSRR